MDKLPPQLLPDAKRLGEPPPALVTPDWLAACLAQRGHASEVPFTVVAGTHGIRPTTVQRPSLFSPQYLSLCAVSMLTWSKLTAGATCSAAFSSALFYSPLALAPSSCSYDLSFL